MFINIWQNLDAIAEDVFVAEAIVWCLTIIWSPTHVTRLKVAPDMAEPIEN